MKESTEICASLILIAGAMLPAAAIAVDGHVVAHALLAADEDPPDALSMMASRLFAESAYWPGDVGRVLLVTGGGSLTGNRCAIAFAKGLASALDVGIEEIDIYDLACGGIDRDFKCGGILISGRRGPLVAARNERLEIVYRNLTEDDFPLECRESLVWTKEAAARWPERSPRIVLNMDVPELVASRVQRVR